MAREPEDADDDSSYDAADGYDLMPDVGDVIWDDEIKPSRRGKHRMPEDEEPREFPKILIYAIIAMVVILPAGIFLYDLSNNSWQSAHTGYPDTSQGLDNANIRAAESDGAVAAGYHDMALTNFSRGQYDAAIDQMTTAAEYSQRSLDGYLAAVRELPRDDYGANVSSEGALYMHEAELRYVEAFKSYRSGDMTNASIFWDEAKYYVVLSADHRINRSG